GRCSSPDIMDMVSPNRDLCRSSSSPNTCGTVARAASVIVLELFYLEIEDIDVMAIPCRVYGSRIEPFRLLAHIHHKTIDHDVVAIIGWIQAEGDCPSTGVARLDDGTAIAFGFHHRRIAGGAIRNHIDQVLIISPGAHNQRVAAA